MGWGNMSPVTGSRFVLAVVGVAIAGMVLLWLSQRRLIYLPDTAAPSIATYLPRGEEIVFEVEDGVALTAWWLPPTTEAVATVVVFPGNAGNRAGRVALAEALSARGMGTLLVDYRGYGGNPGSPTEAALVADAVAIVERLAARDDVDPASIVYFGESLGAGVAVAAAAIRPPAVLVLRSPFSSLRDVAAVHYPWLPVSSLLWDRYPNLELVAELDVPVLVVAGSDDEIVPLQQSRAVYEAAPGPKQLMVVEGAGHNDFALLAGDRLIDAVGSFIVDHVGS